MFGAFHENRRLENATKKTLRKKKSRALALLKNCVDP